MERISARPSAWRAPIRAATATRSAPNGEAMPLKAARRGAIPPFIVMDVLRAANRRQLAGGDVLHLELGQPATAAPAAVIEAARAALDVDRLGYTEAFGLERLR